MFRTHMHRAAHQAMHNFISYERLARLRGGKKKKWEKKKKASRQDTLRLRSARFGARLENVKVVFSLYRFVRGHRTDYGGSKAKLAIAVKIKTRKGRRIFRVLGGFEKNKEAGTRIESRKIVIHEVPLDNIVARCFCLWHRRYFFVQTSFMNQNKFCAASSNSSGIRWTEKNSCRTWFFLGMFRKFKANDFLKWIIFCHCKQKEKSRKKAKKVLSLCKWKRI